MDIRETVTLAEVAAHLKTATRFPKKGVSILCGHVEAIPFRDLFEVYLAVSGAGRWEWRDGKGRVAPKSGLSSSLGRLAGDFLRWPGLYGNIMQEVEQLKSTAFEAPGMAKPACLLYLRTDHSFNLTGGGSVSHTSGVISGLRNLGVRTQVVSTDVLTGVPSDLDFHLCFPQYRKGANLPNMPDVHYSRQVFQFVKNNWSLLAPQWVYQRYSPFNYAGVLLKREFRVPFVCEYNGSVLWMSRNWGSGRLFHERLAREIELLNLQWADRIVVVSEPSRDELTGRGIPSHKILVNPNAVDETKYSPNVSGSRVRGQYGLEGKTVLGFIGTFGPWHGAEILAEAYVRLLKENPDCRESTRLLLIGGGKTLARVQQVLESGKAGDNCLVTGLIPQEEGPEHLAACDILVSPHVPNPDGTPFFGSPIKLFEYMAMGKPIVASNLDQIGRVLNHGETAWLVAPGDADALMNGLLHVLRDPELGHRLGKNARVEAETRYTWKEHSRKIIESADGGLRP